MEIYSLVLLFFVSLIASTYGTVVGGGSLLTIPTLIFLGLPPQIAIATNRLGVLGSGLGGMYHFGKKKLINYKLGFVLAFFAFIGALIGANLMLRTNDVILKKVVAVITIVILLFIVFKSKIGIKERIRKIRKVEWFSGTIFFLIIGIYAGFYGAGSGTFMSYVLILIFGQTFLQSAATRKIPGLTQGITAAIVFILNKKVLFSIGILMFIAMLMGSYIGAHYSTKIGNVWVKRAFFVLVLIMAIKLLF